MMIWLPGTWQILRYGFGLSGLDDDQGLTLLNGASGLGNVGLEVADRLDLDE